MPFDKPNSQFRDEGIDLRTIDAQVLLKSKLVDDKILAILCHADNEQQKVRRILHSLRPLPAKIQGDKITQLLILSRLRGLTDMITQETQKGILLRQIVDESPVLTKLFDERVKKLATALAKKLANERADKLVEQRIKKVRKDSAKDASEFAQEEARKVLTRQLETLHGKLPKWAKEKIATANTRTLEKWAVRLLKAETLEEALR